MQRLLVHMGLHFGEYRTILRQPLERFAVLIAVGRSSICQVIVRLREVLDAFKRTTRERRPVILSSAIILRRRT